MMATQAKVGRARVALVHDWLTGMRGGEYVLEAMAELFPEAEIFTLIAFKDKISERLASLPIHTSALQNIPGIEEKYRHFLPAMPYLAGRFDLSGFDLVISSSHCVAKGVRKAEGAVHLSYIHAPMRYMWQRFEDYFGPGKSSLPVRLVASAIRKPMQDWDRSVSTEARVDRLIANSCYVAAQVEENYGRKAGVIYPFADLSRFSALRRPEPHYLMVGAFAPNKRVDLAIEAFNRLALPLKIVGKGQEEARLRAMAGPTIEFLGGVSNEEIAEQYSRCRAFIFPGIEDAGITPMEAMAAGAPVIAFGEGGASETVTEKTGVFFRSQTVEALSETLAKFDAQVSGGQSPIAEADCRARASFFTKARFQEELGAEIRKLWSERGKNPEELWLRP